MLFKSLPKIVAIIPARGGSKGIKRKNMAITYGFPLITYTMVAANRTAGIDKIYVSSEDKSIQNFALNHGANVLARPKSLANDTSTCEEVLEYCLKRLRQHKLEFDVVVLLQPTSPLRTHQDIETAIDLYLNCDATSLVSVCEVQENPLKQVFVDEHGYIQPISSKHATVNRQNLPKVYKQNGAIYITSVKHFLKTGSLFAKKTIPFLMPVERSIDVDTKEDLKKVEEYFCKTIKTQ